MLRREDETSSDKNIGFLCNLRLSLTISAAHKLFLNWERGAFGFSANPAPTAASAERSPDNSSRKVPVRSGRISFLLGRGRVHLTRPDSEGVSKHLPPSHHPSGRDE